MTEEPTKRREHERCFCISGTGGDGFCAECQAAGCLDDPATVQCRVEKGKLAELSSLRAALKAAEGERDTAKEESARQALMDAQIIARFDDNPDAHTWLGWTTPPDSEGRQFEIQIGLLGGKKSAVQHLDELRSAKKAAEEKAQKATEAVRNADSALREIRERAAGFRDVSRLGTVVDLEWQMGIIQHEADEVLSGLSDVLRELEESR